MNLEIETDLESYADVCKDYWQQNDPHSFSYTVKEIAEKHSMKVHAITSFIRKHSYIWFEEICCESCGTPYHLTSRAQYASRNLYIDTQCNACSEAAHKAVIDKKTSIIESIKKCALRSPKEIHQLSLTDRIFLACAIQALGSESLTQLTSIADNPSCALSPDSTYDRKIVRHLIDQRLSWLSSHTPLTSLQIQDDENFTLDLINSRLEIPFSASELISLINKFSLDAYQEELIHNDEFYQLCSEVQLLECIAFLKYSLAEHQLHFSPGDKTQLVLSQCLRYFSVAQTYNLVWRAVKDSAAYYMRGSVRKLQAANSVVGNINRNMEKALANGWEITPFKRNYKIPQSAISQLLFNTVLGTDDGGFHYKLSELLAKQE